MTPERPRIERLELAGFKSIREAVIDFTGLNVLIGSNGAGKSNLVSFFAMLRAFFNKRLNEYVARNGGPNALLHLGVKQTSEIRMTLTIHTPEGKGLFHQSIGFRAPDGLQTIENFLVYSTVIGRIR